LKCNNIEVADFVKKERKKERKKESCVILANSSVNLKIFRKSRTRVTWSQMVVSYKSLYRMSIFTK